VASAQTGAVLQGDDHAGPLTVDQTLQLVRQGGVVLIDVRDAKDFDRAHLPGAISVPLDELVAHVQELRAQGRPVIVYCCGRARGVDSAQAVATLRSLGVDEVHAIAGGFQRWVDAGYVVEVPPSV
jgi:ArsR family transcriptional regulator